MNELDKLSIEILMREPVGSDEFIPILAISFKLTDFFGKPQTFSFSATLSEAEDLCATVLKAAQHACKVGKLAGINANELDEDDDDHQNVN